MKKILQKVDRIRASGTAILNVPVDSPFAIYNGRRFKVDSMGTPDHKCRVSIIIKERRIDVKLNEVI